MITFFILIAFGCLIFAFIQRAEAKRQEQLSNVLAAKAQQSEMEALKQKDMAEQAREMAVMQRMEAEKFAKRMEEASQKKK